MSLLATLAFFTGCDSLADGNLLNGPQILLDLGLPLPGFAGEIPADIIAATIAGDTLRIQVEYGGGCGLHHFQLVSAGAFRESHPVQTDVRLIHAAEYDPCRALLYESLAFDLSPLKGRYRQAYDVDTGVIILRLSAPGGGSVTPAEVFYGF